jgi:hypothetical protein
MKIYHVSEEAGIEIFHPRPSAQFYKDIKGDVVFAINDKMLHNYLLPRECPRVTFYAKPDSAGSDIEKFIGISEHKFIIAVEDRWSEKIKQTVLYLYELPNESFIKLDEGAGYYVSYRSVKPVSKESVSDIPAELAKRNAELRFMPSIKAFADEISKSSLQFSIIRLRNAA